MQLFVSGTFYALSRLPQIPDGIGNIVVGPNLDLRQMWQVNGQAFGPSLLNATDVEAVTKAHVAGLCTAKPDIKGPLDEENLHLGHTRELQSP